MLGEMSHLSIVLVEFWNKFRDIPPPNNYVNNVKGIAAQWIVNSPNITMVSLPYGFCIRREKGGEWGW